MRWRHESAVTAYKVTRNKRRLRLIHVNTTDIVLSCFPPTLPLFRIPRPHTCISSGCQGYRFVLLRLHVTSYTYGYRMRWRHESAVTAYKVTRSTRCLTHIHVNRDHAKADAEFKKQFLDNKFDFVCSVCDRLWFEKDLRPVPRGSIGLLATEFPGEDVSTLEHVTPVTSPSLSWKYRNSRDRTGSCIRSIPRNYHR